MTAFLPSADTATARLFGRACVRTRAWMNLTECSVQRDCAGAVWTRRRDTDESGGRGHYRPGHQAVRCRVQFELCWSRLTRRFERETLRRIEEVCMHVYLLIHCRMSVLQAPEVTLQDTVANTVRDGAARGPLDSEKMMRRLTMARAEVCHDGKCCDDVITAVAGRGRCGDGTPEANDTNERV